MAHASCQFDPDVFASSEVLILIALGILVFLFGCVNLFLASYYGKRMKEHLDDSISTLSAMTQPAWLVRDEQLTSLGLRRKRQYWAALIRGSLPNLLLFVLIAASPVGGFLVTCLGTLGGAT